MAETGRAVAPTLAGDALAAVFHRGSHVQIIAAAGSGKTEVVAQRVADLLAQGVPATGIVAFTFTERAADELAKRISARVEERLGRVALDHLAGLFVGTIHAYCFLLLQQRVPRYETYDVLDDNQLTAFLAREASRLSLRDLDDRHRLFASIEAFLSSVDVVENELLDPAAMPPPFRDSLLAYYESLDRHRLLTYGQQVVRAVKELERRELATLVRADLRHLIVDEYQDVNPAQERLIELLTGPAVELCVVGDDDQAIYQWRGADVTNIVTFAERHPSAATFEITTNRRSRPQIIEAANRFARTIPGRLHKTMRCYRPPADPPGVPEVVVWYGDSELEEAGRIAEHILNLAEAGVAYRDIAVVVRGRVAYPRLMEQFATFGIPVQPGGRTGLFDTPEACVLGRTVAWLTNTDWRDATGRPTAITTDGLLDEYRRIFALSDRRVRRLHRFLGEWKEAVPREDRRADLVGELYDLLAELDVRSWNLGDPLQVNRLGTLARFSSLLVDYESVRRRARTDDGAPGEQVGGQDRGTWHYKNLAIHIMNYARGAYEGFDGEPDFDLDAVDLTTVHRAKGLEWPVVFIPSLTTSRFPASRTGRQGSWLVPRGLFTASRYEGSDADERRLFYVALTRARDWVSVSRHARVNTRATAPSPYYVELHELEVGQGEISPPLIEAAGAGGRMDEPISISYSELATFLDCAMAFRLRDRIGFMPRLAPELGYGKAIHHVMRSVAEATRARGHVPSPAEINTILDTSFFLPTASQAAHRQLRAAAQRLVTRYVTEHEADLYRVWQTERPFDLHLDGIVVSGRADVILDHESGVSTALAIVDYKTSTTGGVADHALQLQVYADAGRREGLDVRAAYVHDLKAASRMLVDLSVPAMAQAEATVTAAALRLRARDYTPNPGLRCRACEVRTVCSAAQR